MRETRVRLAVPFAEVVLFAWVCGCVQDNSVTRLAVPQPSLDGVSQVVVDKIEALQRQVEALQRPGKPDPRRLSAAFLDLGRAYQAFELTEAAIPCYRNTISLAQDDYRGHYYLGLALVAEGELEQARQAFRRALQLSSSDTAIRLRLGETALELNDLGAAWESFERVLETEPESAAAHFGLGKVAAQRGEAREAILQFEKALELDPAATILHYHLGQQYRRLGELEKAEGHLSQQGKRPVAFRDPLARELARLKVTTAFEIVHTMAADKEVSDDDLLGYAIVRFGDVDGAVGEFARSLQTGTGKGEDDPFTRARAHYVAGGLYLRNDDFAAATEHLEQALRWRPEFETARYELAHALWRQRRLADALGHLSALLEANPEHSAALVKRAAVLADLDREQEAITDLVRTLELDPTRVEARLRLASLYEDLEQRRQAMEQYRAALQIDTEARDLALAHFRLARLLEGHGSLGERQAHLEMALRLDPELTEARRALAAVLGQRGRYEEAASQYRTIVEAEPKDRRARLGEAAALILVGRHAEARRRLEEGLEALPRDLRLSQTLARHLAACPDPSIRDGQRALQLARWALAAQPSPQNAETLAMALAEAGRFDEAVRRQEDLVRRARTAGDRRNLPRLQANLERYRQGKSCCARPKAE